ncbi:MAG TPA: hypothetical protein VFB38_24655 [Chthonomonadaceae bacterium]|nr:hypothetical protein [Chthonomonadaceae bacterium]
MRAVSLSDLRVIAMLNRYFVPVFVSNEDYGEKGCAPPEERAELNRIHQEGYAAHLSVGTVHAFVLSPTGHTLDSLHVAQAFKPDTLLAMLERTVQKLGTTPGEPVFPPAPRPAPQTPPGALMLHLTARYLQRKGDDYALIEDTGGNWSALPGEDWITLTQAQWKRLLPPGPVRVGGTWDIDPEVAASLLLHFYPPTENNDLTTNRIDRESLQATILSVSGGIARARIEGALTMKHPFYHKDDQKFAEATLLGYITFDTKKRKVRSLRLVTEDAVYRGDGSQLPYGVAVTSR